MWFVDKAEKSEGDIVLEKAEDSKDEDNTDDDDE